MSVSTSSSPVDHMPPEITLALPPVDQYRAPFVVPIGHLAMQAAYVDAALVELCGILASLRWREELGPKPTTEDAAATLRNWGDGSKAYVRELVATIGDDYWRSQVQDAVDRFEQLRTLRHRAIHDAIEVGILPDGDGAYSVIHLSAGYVKEGATTKRRLAAGVSPASIVAIAIDFYELHKDLETAAHVIGEPLNE